MPTIHYYGKGIDFVGKTLFEILANSRNNVGFNKILIRQQHILVRKPGIVRSYCNDIRKVEPVINILNIRVCHNALLSHQSLEPFRLALSQQHHRRLSSSTSAQPAPAPPPSPPEKRTLGKKIVDEIKHYYHGFRLLFIDLRISSRYVKKLLTGEQLSRREHQQLIRSTSDLFRLLPFSVFIIVPFMEFLLPVFLKFFPSMLPSTFQTTKDKDAKIKSQLKVKIDMAKFLQKTLDEMAFQAKGESHSDEAKKFAKFFEEVRASGAGASNTDILKYSKLFEDEITLDSMTRQQLVACCKLLELQPIGTNVFLRYQLKARLKALKGDDEMIQNEGIQSLTVSELQAACRARGMRALGVPIERLQEQLSQWLELSLYEKIPPSLLLLSRALYVPENIPTAEQLKATIQSLPELAGTEVRYNIGEHEGKIDNKTKAEFLKQEEEEIQREELQESVESFKSNYDESLIDKAEEIIERAAKMHQTTILKVVRQKSEKNDLTMEFLESIERDLDKLLSDKDEILSGIEHPEEEYDLRELKEEMEEYREEIGEKELQRIRESKAARRLSKRVDKMIVNLDKVLDKIEEREKELKELRERQELIAQKYGSELKTKRPEEKQSN